ncbi:hypothetical protein V2G26_011496 [Clonostachys chloroleuca]
MCNSHLHVLYPWISQSKCKARRLGWYANKLSDATLRDKYVDPMFSSKPRTFEGDSLPPHLPHKADFACISLYSSSGHDMDICRPLSSVRCLFGQHGPLVRLWNNRVSLWSEKYA